MGELLRQAMAMQQQLLEAQADARRQTVTGSAGGGLVRITMTGDGDVTAIRIAPEAIDPSDPDLLEDLVLAAFRDAQHQIRALQETAMGGLADLAGNLGAVGLDALGDLGGPGDLGALPARRRDDAEDG
jgi:DNA-binding YbaB/EbfC family protein